MVDLVGYSQNVLKLQEAFNHLPAHKSENKCAIMDKQFECIYTGNLDLAPNPGGKFR